MENLLKSRLFAGAHISTPIARAGRNCADICLSYYNNERREIPTTFHPGYVGSTPICVIETYSEKPGELFLTDFGIDEEMQYSGYGRQFIGLFENFAKEKGYETIRLPSHPDSYGFYVGLDNLIQVKCFDAIATNGMKVT